MLITCLLMKVHGGQRKTMGTALKIANVSPELNLICVFHFYVLWLVQQAKGAMVQLLHPLLSVAATLAFMDADDKCKQHRNGSQGARLSPSLSITLFGKLSAPECTPRHPSLPVGMASHPVTCSGGGGVRLREW